MGTLAVAVNIIRYCSPLVALPEVIKKKYADAIPGTLSVACYINNPLWFIYVNIVMNDVMVYGPNLFRFS